MAAFNAIALMSANPWSSRQSIFVIYWVGLMAWAVGNARVEPKGKGRRTQRKAVKPGLGSGMGRPSRPCPPTALSRPASATA